MKYLLAAASALLVASPALAHGPATTKRHYHSLGHHGHHAGTHRHLHCHKKREVCHWHKHGHWGKDAGHHGKSSCIQSTGVISTITTMNTIGILVHPGRFTYTDKL